MIPLARKPYNTIHLLYNGQYIVCSSNCREFGKRLGWCYDEGSRDKLLWDGGY